MRRRASVTRAAAPAVLPSDLLFDIAEYLPSEQQFGSLRSVSREFRDVLPQSPVSGQPQFWLRMTHMDSEYTQDLGLFDLPHVLRLLRDIQSGKAPVRAGILPSITTLYFYNAPLNQFMPLEHSSYHPTFLLNTTPALRVNVSKSVHGDPHAPKLFWTFREPHRPLPIDQITSQLWRAHDLVRGQQNLLGGTQYPVIPKREEE